MNKKLLLFGSFFTVFFLSSQLQAALAWVKVRNKTPWDLAIWWEGHYKNYDEANAAYLKKNRSAVFVLGKKGMNGPLHLAKEIETRGRQSYYYTFTTPEKKPYFFPINKGATFYKVLTLRPGKADKTGIRIRQSYPDIHFFGLGKKPYVSLKRKRIIIRGEESEIR